MRALVVHPGPDYSPADMFRGWVTALHGLGVRVWPYNLNDRYNFFWSAHLKLDDGTWRRSFTDYEAVRLATDGILQAAYKCLPDVALVISGLMLPYDVLDLLRARGVKVVAYMSESPYQDDVQLKLAEHADMVLLNDPTNIDRFREVSPTYYMPHAYDPAVHFARPPVARFKSDFAFIGTFFQSRVEFFEAVDWAGIDVLLGGFCVFGNDSPLMKFVKREIAHRGSSSPGRHAEDDLGGCCDNATTADVYASTKASANIYRREADESDIADGWAMGPREVELAATETFFLTEARGENRDVLPMVPTFTGPSEFEEQLRWWLTHDDERQAVAERARAAIEDRTFENNARRFLHLLEELNYP